MHTERTVLDADDVRRTLLRIAHEIVERNAGVLPPGAGDADRAEVAIVGVHRRGALLATRLRALLAELLPEVPPLGDLDISFYRDDVALRGGERSRGTRSQHERAPVVHATHLEFELEARTVVLVDDVLFTGRTARAAIEALFDYGRPARVQLAVLADRGHRELPIRPDYVGKNLPTAIGERVNVRLTELDGVDEVTVASAGGDPDGTHEMTRASA